jgi:hypothetical protein
MFDDAPTNATTTSDSSTLPLPSPATPKKRKRKRSKRCPDPWTPEGFSPRDMPSS